MRKPRLPALWQTTTTDRAKVAALRAEGISTRDVARRFGRSDDWVRDQMRRFAEPARIPVVGGSSGAIAP